MSCAPGTITNVPVCVLYRSMRTLTDYIRLIPKVSYFYEDAWKARDKPLVVPGAEKPKSGRAQMKKGINAQQGYMTWPDGTPISADRAGEFHALGKEFWRTYALEHGVKALPTTWHKGAPSEFKRDFYFWMNSRAPESQFCYQNWWAERMAINDYSQWRRGFVSNYDKDCALKERVPRKRKSAKAHTGHGTML